MEESSFIQELKHRLVKKETELSSLLSRINGLQEAAKALRVLIQQETGETIPAPSELSFEENHQSDNTLALVPNISSPLIKQPMSPTKAGRAFVRSNPKAVFSAATLTEYLKKLDEQGMLKHGYSSLDNIGHTVTHNLEKTKDIVHMKNSEHPKLYTAK